MPLSPLLAAKIYLILTAVVILFQLALALGAPWGSLSMGGKFPGKYPAKMRVAALFNIALLSFFAALVASKAGLALVSWQTFSAKAIWLVVVFSTIGLVLNSITPSKWERILWAPVALVLLLCNLVVALS